VRVVLLERQAAFLGKGDIFRVWLHAPHDHL
jgi:hypothetical protein